MALRLSFVVQYSRRGREQLWSSELRCSGSSDGPEEAVEIRKALAEVTGIPASAIGLNILPRQCGGPQSAVKPVSGQSLLSFLEQSCREDHGVFQLRASFDHPSSEDFVQVRVACPGTAPAKAAANSSETQPPPIVIEQFELENNSTVAALKELIHQRSKFPLEQMVLLLGCRRLQDELPIHRVSAAAEASTPALLQLHLAVRGAMAFLRREGQGHRHSQISQLEEPGEVLKLILPECVPGRDRFDRLPLTLEQSVSDLRWAVQSVSGLSPARMRLLLDGETDLSTADESSSLSNLGFEDGSTLVVEQSAAGAALRDVDMPVDIPATGCANAVYETAATMLGLPDSSKLSLFAGSELINRNADLSLAPIADGVILSAYINSPLQLPVHVLQSGLPSDLGLPGHVAVRSCDAVAEVRQRLLGSASSEMRAETETCLDGSLAFAVESGVWEREGGDCQSLASLEALLGHFTQCLDTARLSRLGMADGGCHMVFVARRILSVEVQVHQGDEWKCICPLRVPSTMRLSELSATLIRTLRHSGQLADLSLSEFAQCSWHPWSPEARSSSSQSFAGGVAAVISKVKRKSLGSSPEVSPEKRARRSYSNVSNVQDLDDAMFLGDLLAQHPEPQNRYQQFLCPISMDIMLDPVVVGGSGNTYDRKSIEKHFQHCHRDPLNNMELRRPADRKLIPNNQLRSQIREAEISRVQLRLSAHLAEQRSFSSDAPMAAYLGWCASLLSRN